MGKKSEDSTSYRNLIEEHDGKVAILTFNRPEKLNALSHSLIEDFSQALKKLKDDAKVRVVIVKGAGRAFSVGYDISNEERGQHTPKSVVEDWASWRNITEHWMEVWDYPKPIIAQIHGYCLAGASQLAVLCDLTYIAEDAQIGTPSLPIGGGFISPMWSWLVGPKRAKEMSFMPGRRISGKEAEHWGWANKAFPANDLDREVRDVAHHIAKVSPDVLRIKKMAINRVMDVQGFRESVFFGCEWDAILHCSPAVEELNELLKKVGTKEAIRRWQERGS